MDRTPQGIPQGGSPSGGAGEDYVVGLDIGGTKIAGGLVAFPSGRMHVRRTIPTAPQRGGHAVLDDALALGAELVAAAPASSGQGPSSDGMVRAIGVGVAELIAPDGSITSAQTIAWRGWPVRERFDRLAPAVVESDVRAAALAEAFFGAGRAFRLFVYLTVGTGISHTLVQDRRPFPGARGNAIILASAPFSSTCPSCGTAMDMVLEDYASGPALVARYNACHAGEVAGGSEVTVAAARGDVVAAEIVRAAGAALGNHVGLLVNVLDPEAIVVGGGLGLAGGLYWESFVAATREHIWAEAARGLPILPAALGADAGIVGAAAAAWRRIVDEANAVGM